MKLLKSQSSWVMVTIILLIGYAISCTKNDQILDTNPKSINTSQLLSVRVTTPPTIDAIIDAQWENSPKIQFETVVPDPTGDLFRGYVGNNIPNVVLRSAYDAENIYFLAEWPDATESLVREPWYFDPATKRWNKESGAPTFTSPTRGAFYEDKIAMLFDIDNSVSGWKSGTCYKSCHTSMSSADGFARHRTNNATERIDMWHWKSVRGGQNFGQFDDQYQDNTYPNGRKSDAGAGGYSNNTQNLTMIGTNTVVAAPKYVIPDRVNYNWILGSEITDGSAKLITSVDTNGVLGYAGGSIDPKSDVEFQRKGTTVGSKAIPYIYMSAFEGSRGDISAKAIYTGTGWILEYKRALKTNDTEKKDVDFSSLSDQYFGFAIFENAQIAHSIKPNLVLKFEK